MLCCSSGTETENLQMHVEEGCCEKKVNERV